MTDPVEDDLNRMPDGQTVDRRKHGYTKLEKMLEDDIDEIQKKLSKFFAIVIAIIVFGLLVGYGLYSGQGTITDDIQTQRYNSLVTLCNDQNKRHDDALARINKNDLATPAIKQQLILLVDELQPKVDDCTIDAKRRVKRD